MNKKKEKQIQDIYKECLEIIENSCENHNFEEKRNALDQYMQNPNSDEAEMKFKSVAYELRTYDFFIKAGFEVKPSNDSKIGPDFHLPGVAYVECTVAFPGREKIFNIEELGEMWTTSLDDPLLGLSRLATRLDDKKTQFDKYIEQQRILLEADLPKIIAIDGSILEEYVGFPELLEMKMKELLYGQGPIRYSYNTKTKVLKNSGYFFKKSSMKNNGSEIPCALFHDEDYKHISAVIFNIKSFKMKFEQSPILYLNPNADKKIDNEQIKAIFNIK